MPTANPLAQEDRLPGFRPKLASFLRAALKSTMLKFFPALLAAAALYAQVPAFEVATIKPAGEINPARIMAGEMKIGMTVDNARVDINFFSLHDLIRTAYRVKTHEVSGPDYL